MLNIIRIHSLACALVASAVCAWAEEKALFNGKDLAGWMFEVDPDEKVARPVEEVWVVQQGLLISTGAGTGLLKHKGDFENYVLTLEWRSMELKGSGVAISGSGSLLVHASDEMGAFHCPKSVEIGLFNDPGSVYLRDVEPFAEKKWAFPAPDFADDAEKEMGQWNQTKVICRGNRLTVFLNGTPVNQVEGLNRTKGWIALKSQRAAFQSPAFYRSLRVRPLSSAAAQEEEAAKHYLARHKALAAAKDAAEEAQRRERE